MYVTNLFLFLFKFYLLIFHHTLKEINKIYKVIGVDCLCGKLDIFNKKKARKKISKLNGKKIRK